MKIDNFPTIPVWGRLNLSHSSTAAVQPTRNDREGSLGQPARTVLQKTAFLSFHDGEETSAQCHNHTTSRDNNINIAPSSTITKSTIMSSNIKYQQRHLRKTLKNIAKNDPHTREVVLNGYSFLNEDVAFLTMALVNNTNINILYLHDCGITAKGAHLLAYALQKNTSLQHLWLNGNKIGSAGAEAIASSLYVNKTLVTLGLANNDVGNYGGKRMAEALTENNSITDIFLEGNRMNERIIDEINRRCAGEEDNYEDDVVHEYNYKCNSCHVDSLDDIDASTVMASVTSSFGTMMLDSIEEESEEEEDEDMYSDDEETVIDEFSGEELAVLFFQTKKKESSMSIFKAFGRMIRGIKIRPTLQ